MLIGEIIPQLYEYLRSNPAARERSEFEHILVDEFQDLNKAEQGVVELLADNATVCIVGDDDQSIYSFKHAHPEGIREWINSNLGADDVQLVECHRCPTQVVEIANSLIARNLLRQAPRALVPLPANGNGDVTILQYQALSAEVTGVANRIAAMVHAGTPPGDILVLAQRSAIGTPIYEALHGQGIPVKSYYAEAELDGLEVQRRFALLKLFVSREDRVALRWLIGTDVHRWGAAGYRRIRTHCEINGISPWEALSQLSDGVLSLAYTQSIVDAFDEVVAELNSLEALPDLPSVIEQLFPDGEEEVSSVRALALEALSQDDEDREALLSYLVDAISKPEIPDIVEEVRIMSLHKSKGLSSPVTFICGCVEGLLPRQPEVGTPVAEANAQIEEARRVFFVGITRVKAAPAEGKPGTLVLSYSQVMPLAAAMRAGIAPARVRRQSAILHASRFIRELGPAAPRPIAS